MNLCRKIIYKADNIYTNSFLGRSRNRLIKKMNHILARLNYILKEFTSVDLLKKNFETDITQIPIQANTQINRLRSFKEHEYKDEYLNKGFSIFDKPIQEMPHFKLIKEYQTNPNLNVEDTDYYELVNLALSLDYEKYKKPYVYYRKERENSGKGRCMDFLGLYKEIKLTKAVDPIDVKATQDGSYIITDGLHRASIACALGFNTVPVKIKSVDEQLSRLIEMLKHHYTNGEKVLYTPIDHPIFNDWKVLRNGTRWSLIEKKFDWKGKNVLDIGCYTGYFSHKIAKLGASVTGIELNDERLNIARRLNKLLKLNVNFIHADLFEYLKDENFDCIIFFSVLHWILKDKGITGVRKALDLISSSSPVMFFGMGQDHEPKMRLKEWNHGLTINKDTIPDLVISNSKYRYFKHLGTSDTGRDVFKFTT